MHFPLRQAAQDQGDCIMSPTRVVESVLREMVNSVVSGEAEKWLHPLPPTKIEAAKETLPDGPTKWHDQCLYECMRCAKRDYNVKRIKRHCREVHYDGKCHKKLTDVAYECILCGKEVSCNFDSLESHVRGQHGFRTLVEFREAYTIDAHLAAIKNLSDENAAAIRSAEFSGEKLSHGSKHGRVSYIDK